MGKGDQRSRRGKIFAGSHGKTRPKYKKTVVIPEARVKAAPAPKEKPVPKVRKKEAAPPEPLAAEAPASTDTPVEPVAAAPVEQAADTTAGTDEGPAVESETVASDAEAPTEEGKAEAAEQ